eukprot:362952-Chlamydomonas_euryale.AAC.7
MTNRPFARGLPGLRRLAGVAAVAATTAAAARSRRRRTTLPLRRRARVRKVRGAVSKRDDIGGRPTSRQAGRQAGELSGRPAAAATAPLRVPNHSCSFAAWILPRSRSRGQRLSIAGRATAAASLCRITNLSSNAAPPPRFQSPVPQVRAPRAAADTHRSVWLAVGVVAVFCLRLQPEA